MKKVIWKRVLVTLLAACMVTVLIPNALPGARAAEEEHTHPDDNGTEWIPLSLEKNGEGEKDVLKAGENLINDNMLPEGNYYLAEDMALSSATTEGGYAVYIAGKSVLCLNGYTLNGKVYADDGCELTITDCGEGGTITRNSSSSVYINRGGSLRLVSGTISSGEGSGGNDQNVYVSATGKFEMLGGTVDAPKQNGVAGSGTMEISGGTISSGYDAIQTSGSGKFTLSGSPVITGGDRNDTASIFLGAGKLITLEGFTGAPNGQPYTVRTPDTSVHQFAAGAVSTDVGSFVPKTAGLMTEYREDGQLWFTQHRHQWDEGWTYDETQHWHDCLGAGACDEDKYEAAAHAADPDDWQVDEETDQHYKKCSVCGAEFSRSDHDWKKGEVVDGTRVDTCETCKVTRTVNVYSVSGKVTNEKDEVPVSNASVELKKGRSKVGVTVTTDENGAYSFSNVEPGVYNVVVTAGEKTVTSMVTVSDSDLPDQDLVIPQSGVNSKLDLFIGKGGTESLTDPIPGVVVGGLQEEAVAQAESDASTVTLSMTAKYYGHSATIELAGIDKISSAVLEAFRGDEINEVKFQLYDFKVQKMDKSGGFTDIPVTEGILTIVIPYSLGGRTNVTVYRHHDGEAKALEKLWSEPSKPEEGTFWADTEHNLIYIYTSKFSAYAIISTNGNNVAEKNPEPEPEAPFVPTYYMRIAESKNGRVVAGSAYTVAGGRVTLTVTPDEGYVLDSITVADNAGKEVEYRDNGDGTYTFTMPYGGVKVTAAFKLKPCDGGDDCPSHSYTDVDISEWYHDGVDYAVRNGLMTGKADGVFDPEGITTRAEMAGILWNLEGRPVVNYLMTFTDVAEGEWYTEAIRWAASERIVSGSDGAFKPKDPITREQMALILYRYAEYKGCDLTKAADFTGYSDADEVSGWAADAMRWAVAESLIEGTSSTALSPSAASTRAQAATVSMNFCENIVK